VRALPAPERLRLVERIVREVADQTPLSPPPTESTPTETTAAAPLPDAIWADVPDDEWDAFTARWRLSRRIVATHRMTALLDTDTLSEIFRGKNPTVMARASAYVRAHQRFRISTITEVEISRGWYHSDK
jgi:hypothetical protein